MHDRQAEQFVAMCRAFSGRWSRPNGVESNFTSADASRASRGGLADFSALFLAVALESDRAFKARRCFASVTAKARPFAPAIGKPGHCCAIRYGKARPPLRLRYGYGRYLAAFPSMSLSLFASFTYSAPGRSARAKFTLPEKSFPVRCYTLEYGQVLVAMHGVRR